MNILKDLSFVMSFDRVYPKSVLMMDNALILYVDQVQDIDNAGYMLWFLPAYSPDINPIE